MLCRDVVVLATRRELAEAVMRPAGKRFIIMIISIINTIEEDEKFEATSTYLALCNGRDAKEKGAPQIIDVSGISCNTMRLRKSLAPVGLK